MTDDKQDVKLPGTVCSQCFRPWPKTDPSKQATDAADVVMTLTLGSGATLRLIPFEHASRYVDELEAAAEKLKEANAKIGPIKARAYAQGHDDVGQLMARMFQARVTPRVHDDGGMTLERPHCYAQWCWNGKRWGDVEGEAESFSDIDALLFALPDALAALKGNKP